MSEEYLDNLLSCRKSLRSEFENLEWNIVVNLIRFTGCHISAVTILRWSDIDLANEDLTKRGKTVGVMCGTGDERCETVMPLWHELRPVLLRLKQYHEQTGYESDDVPKNIGNLEKKPEFDICRAEDGVKLKQGRFETNLQKTYKEILKRNGLKIPAGAPYKAIRKFRWK